MREGCESGREIDVSGNAIATRQAGECDCAHDSPLADRPVDTVPRMHRSRLGQIIIDCNGDLERAAAFWAAALGHRASTLSDPQDAHYRQLDVETDQPRILLQRVEHPSRVHLDIETDDVEAEVRRLEALGARRIAQVRTWWVMEAPTGHRFCVLPPQRPDFAERGGMRGH